MTPITIYYFFQALPVKPTEMHLPVPAVLIGFFIHTSLGASLGVIDQDRQCLIWSNDNHACTGYSEPFAELNGSDCSGNQLYSFEFEYSILTVSQN